MSEEHKLPRLVLRVARRRLADLAGMTLHQSRSGGDLRHVDLARTRLNGVFVGSGNPGADVRSAIDAVSRQNLINEVAVLRATRGKKAAEKRLRLGPVDPWDAKNAAPWNELVLSASPEFFRAPGQGPGEWDQERVEIFAARARSILRKRFGSGLVHLALHLDEETPHVHAAVLPLVRRRSARRGLQRLVSHRQHPAFREQEAGDEPLGHERSYERLQDEFAQEFADLGLVRGERRAEAARIAQVLGQSTPEAVRHRTTAEWRAEQAAVVEDLEAQRDWQTAENIRLEAEGSRAKKAQRASRAAQEAADARSMVAEGVSAGAAALAAQELAYKPPTPEGPETIVWGPKASTKPSWRQALVRRVQPARAQVLELARLVHGAVERQVREALARLDGRERAVEARERAMADRAALLSQREHRVERDAASVAAARTAVGVPVPEALSTVAARRRPVRNGDER